MCDLVDLNGDGLVDFVWNRLGGDSKAYAFTFMNQGDSFCYSNIVGPRALFDLYCPAAVPC